MRYRVIILIICLSLFSVVRCTQKESGTHSGTVTTAPVRVVNLAIWSNYLSTDLLAEFQKKTGIKVQISNYSSNEELLAKLQAGASGYDVALPSDYMLFAMIKLGLLKPIDFTKLPNSKSLDRKFFGKSYDPENQYSIPYDWGTTGIAINRALYSKPVKSWKDLFESPELSGRISLLDDAREVIGAVLKSQGYSLNSKNPKELQKAKEILFKLKKRVKAFTSEPKMPLINGEVAAAHIYASDALQARKTLNDKIDYVIPSEGSTYWIDNWVIPKGAENIKEAYAFIDFLLDAQSSVSTSLSLMLAPTNRLAFGLLPKSYQQNTMLFPTSQQLKRCEMIEDLGEFLSNWEQLWTEFKAQN